MSNRAQITRQAAADDVPAQTVERDYVLAHIVAGLASLDRETGLVFKGGTALRLCYFEDYRYSADLDFSVTAGTLADAYGTLAEALTTVGGFISGLGLTDDSPPRISYIGPLNRKRMLKLDIADDELVLNAETVSLLSHWSDLPSGLSLPVYSLAEIAGEKIRCVIQRAECRDMYDLWSLFTSGQVDIHEAADIFRHKASHRDIDPATLPEKYTGRLAQYRQRWQQELQHHIQGNIPEFNGVERAVSRNLRTSGLLGR